MKTVKKLQKGDIIGIVTPAGFIKEGENLADAIQLIKSWDLQVKLGKNTFNKHHHFAGTDKERTDDFQTFLDDKNIKAIWCARGGYGSIRIIDKLDFTEFKKNPKWIVGYSDITVFHQAVNALGFESIHAIMPTSIETIKNNDLKAVTSFKKALFNEALNYKIKPNKHNRLGTTTGKLIGGNLAIIASLLGTKYALQPKNNILFREEIGEYKYRIDRMLHSLKLNGYFENCKGLILGGFTNIPKNDPNFGMTIEELVLNVVKEYDFPVCFDFPAGHITNNNALILGRKITLTITKTKAIINF